MPSSWLDRAARRHVDRDLFFSAKNATKTAQALAICNTCPVVAECREFALKFPSGRDHGVFGATVPSERRRIRASSAVS